VACNPDVGKKRVVISRGSSWTVGMPVTSMIFGKESGCQGDSSLPWHLSKKGEEMYDSRTEEGMGSDLRWALDDIISKYTDLPSYEYYRENGVYEHLKGIIAAIYVEVAK